MDLYILDKSFNTLFVFDVYESFIWTDRFDEFGDFEAYLSPYEPAMEHLTIGNYIWRKDSEHMMIIKKVQITTDPVEGAHAIVTGESLESILKDRVIAQQTVLSGNLQNGIRKLLNQTIITPSDSNRRIGNFVFRNSGDSAITSLLLDAQYFGENLYDVISEICYDKHIGFKITLDDANQFVFELYTGVDRSYGQENRPYVVFSPRYENLLNSDYVYDVDNVRNVAYICGEEPDLPEEDEEEDPENPKPKPIITTQIVAMTGGGSGLNRKEIFVDGSNLKTSYRDDDNQVVYLSEAEYRPQLEQKGREELAEYYAEKSFDGQILDGYQWTLGIDYFMGDIVQVENEYGMTARSRVVEMITSEDTSGQQFYPSFEAVT